MICSDGEIDHAVLLVGWGRDEFLDEEYFIVKNHFGEEWGEKGYARISSKLSMIMSPNSRAEVRRTITAGMSLISWG